ncbi:MAG: GTPase HflX [Candidatus Delongbacteria bacterium]|jgi:GTP-binding protein HflX|nr:GTPase HflX [Candidatus Delongbacteria bacterium]
METIIEKIIPKAFLVGVCLNKRDLEQKEISLEELERLADTAGIETKGKFIQSRKGIEKSTYVGKGFLEDIKAKMEMVEADILIFDNELSPTQGRNILKKHEIEAIDRTELILAIFHDHARTKEAKLEVRLAELKYQLPRLKKLWGHLDRERGASGSGTGASRGMGEKQIEVDKRIVRHEIGKIGEELSHIMKQKITQRKQRENIKKVCLVGYTNSGKSTLFNKVTGADVLVEDKLFATLDSTARSLELEKGKSIILSDTVGFISSLPGNLVASFRATLKDVNDADLLVHVVDISDDNCEEQIKAVDIVLKEIEAHEIPSVLVFNKVDMLSEHRVREEIFIDKYPKSVIISAVTGENIEKLLKKIDDMLNLSSVYKLLFPFEEQKLLAQLHDFGNVISKEFTDEGVIVEAVVNSEDLNKVEKYIVKT